MEEEARKFRAAVITQVIKDVKNLFIEQGVQEELVEQLQKFWEARIAQYMQPRNAIADA